MDDLWIETTINRMTAQDITIQNGIKINNFDMQVKKQMCFGMYKDGKQGSNLVTLKDTTAIAVKEDENKVLLIPERKGKLGWRWQYYALENVLMLMGLLALVKGTAKLLDYLSLIEDQLHPYMVSAFQMEVESFSTGQCSMSKG
ncbi:hypothetical protein TNCV_4900641 [Trichonephila clavipes]|nr:hypothetical protein TNCV_4900641 [Trichonephila clavipes]